MGVMFKFCTENRNFAGSFFLPQRVSMLVIVSKIEVTMV